VLQDQAALGYDCPCNRLPVAGGRNARCKYCDFAPHSDQIRRQVLTCRSTDLSAWLDSVGGLEFDDLIALPTVRGLPGGYIPQITTGLLAMPLRPWYAVSSNVEFVSKRLLSGRPLGDLKTSLGVPALSSLVLLMFGKDRHVESLWNNWDNVLDSIASSNVSLVVPPDYSLLWDEPRMEHLFNMKRSLVAFSQLQKAGISAIPHMFWHRTIDVERHAEWLLNNPCVRMIAVNLQDCKRKDEKELYFRGLGLLQQRIGGQIQFLIGGLQSYADLRRLSALLGCFCLVNKQAYFRAFWRDSLEPSKHGLARVRMQSARPSELFAKNCSAFDDLLRDARRAS
jgi:hypothetical protein